MPRDSSGNCTLYTPGNPVTTGTTIASAWGNNTLTDIINMLTNSLDRSGNGGMLNQFKAVDGTAGAPGISFVSEPATGLYRIGANQVGLSIGGALRLTFTTTAITAAAGIKLNLTSGAAANALGITTVDGTPAINIGGPATTQITALSFQQTGQSAWSIYQPTTVNDFRLSGAGADRLIITDQGALSLPIPVSNVIPLNAKAFAAGVAASFVDSTAAYAIQFTPGAAAQINNVGGTSLVLKGGGASVITIPSAGNITISGLTVTAGLLVNALGATITGTLQVPASGITVGGPTGGDEGIGTVNVLTGYYVNGVAIGQGAIYAVKAADENRTSTTALTNDNTLTYAIPAAGKYEFEFVLYVTVGANGIGIDVNVNFSGSFTVGNFIDLGSLGTTDNGANISAAVNNPVLTRGLANNTAANPYFVMLKGSIVATGAGTIAVAYSQNVSNATPTVIKAGSYMRIAKMA